MKKLIYLSPLVLLAGCEALSEGVQQPAVQQQFTKAAEELASGNWPGALVAAVGGGGTLVSWLVGKWLYGRVKDSKEGEIIA